MVFVLDPPSLGDCGAALSVFGHPITLVTMKRGPHHRQPFRILL